MEAFTLLKSWHALFTGDASFTARPAAKIVCARPCSDDGEDGPYFDLEFTLTDDDCEEAADDAASEKPMGMPLLKLKQSKSANTALETADQTSLKSEANGEISAAPKTDKKEYHGKDDDELLEVRFEVEEVKGSLAALFARENCLKANHLKHSMQDSDSNSASDERRLTKEVPQKYSRTLKPLYYIEKMKPFGQVSFPAGGSKGDGAVCPSRTAADNKGHEVVAPTHQKSGNKHLQSGLKVVLKHLGKSRSTSAAEAVSPPGMMSSDRRDDSLLELQDGIQGAILHCKRSFNSSRVEF